MESLERVSRVTEQGGNGGRLGAQGYRQATHQEQSSVFSRSPAPPEPGTIPSAINAKALGGVAYRAEAGTSVTWLPVWNMLRCDYD